MLAGAGRGAKRAAGVADTLGPDAARRLKDDPWALLSLHGVGLGDADRLAIAVLSGADRQDSRRGRAIVGLNLRTATRDGHTVLPADLVVAALQAEGISDPVAAIVAAVESGDVLEHEPPEPEDPDAEPDPALRTLSLARYGMAEELVAEAIARLAATARRVADPAARRERGEGPDPQQGPRVRAERGEGARRAAGRRRRPGSRVGGQPAHRRSGHREEPHRRRRREAAAGQGR